MDEGTECVFCSLICLVEFTFRRIITYIIGITLLILLSQKRDDKREESVCRPTDIIGWLCCLDAVLEFCPLSGVSIQAMIFIYML